MSTHQSSSQAEAGNGGAPSPPLPNSSDSGDDKSPMNSILEMRAPLQPQLLPTMPELPPAPIQAQLEGSGLGVGVGERGADAGLSSLFVLATPPAVPAHSVQEELKGDHYHSRGASKIGELAATPRRRPSPARGAAGGVSSSALKKDRSGNQDSVGSTSSPSPRQHHFLYPHVSFSYSGDVAQGVGGNTPDSHSLQPSSSVGSNSLDRCHSQHRNPAGRGGGLGKKPRRSFTYRHSPVLTPRSDHRDDDDDEDEDGSHLNVTYSHLLDEMGTTLASLNMTELEMDDDSTDEDVPTAPSVLTMLRKKSSPASHHLRSLSPSATSVDYSFPSNPHHEGALVVFEDGDGPRLTTAPSFVEPATLEETQRGRRSGEKGDREHSSVVASKKKEPSSVLYVFSMVCVFFLSGAMQTLVIKWMNGFTFPSSTAATIIACNTTNGTTIYEELPGELVYYEHPYILVWLILFGETLSLPIYHLSLWLRERRGEELIEGVDYGGASIRWYHYLLIALGTVAGQVSFMMALVLTDASVFAALKKSSLIFTVLISIIWLKKKFHSYQWLGLALVIVGATIIFFTPVLDDAIFGTNENTNNLIDLRCGPRVEEIHTQGEEEAEGNNKLLGAGLVLVGSLFTSLFINGSEVLMRKHGIHPADLIGRSSSSSWIMMTFIIAAMQPWADDSDQLDSVAQWWDQGLQDWRVWFGQTLVIIVSFVFSVSSNMVTKLTSGVTRKVLSSARTVIVWVVTLAIPAYGETWSWVQCVGLVILLLGTFVYGHVIKLPCKFFQKSPLVEKKKMEDKIIVVQNLMLSPEEWAALAQANRQDVLPAPVIDFIVKYKEEKELCANQNLRENVEFAAGKFLALIGRVRDAPGDNSSFGDLARTDSVASVVSNFAPRSFGSLEQACSTMDMSFHQFQLDRAVLHEEAEAEFAATSGPNGLSHSSISRIPCGVFVSNNQASPSMNNTFSVLNNTASNLNKSLSETTNKRRPRGGGISVGREGSPKPVNLRVTMKTVMEAQRIMRENEELQQMQMQMQRRKSSRLLKQAHQSPQYCSLHNGPTPNKRRNPLIQAHQQPYQDHHHTRFMSSITSTLEESLAEHPSPLQSSVHHASPIVGPTSSTPGGASSSPHPQQHGLSSLGTASSTHHVTTMDSTKAFGRGW